MKSAVHEHPRHDAARCGRGARPARCRTGRARAAPRAARARGRTRRRRARSTASARGSAAATGRSRGRSAPRRTARSRRRGRGWRRRRLRAPAPSGTSVIPCSLPGLSGSGRYETTASQTKIATTTTAREPEALAPSPAVAAARGGRSGRCDQEHDPEPDRVDDRPAREGRVRVDLLVGDPLLLPPPPEKRAA